MCVCAHISLHDVVPCEQDTYINFTPDIIASSKWYHKRNVAHVQQFRLVLRLRRPKGNFQFDGWLARAHGKPWEGRTKSSVYVFSVSDLKQEEPSGVV